MTGAIYANVVGLDQVIHSCNNPEFGERSPIDDHWGCNVIDLIIHSISKARSPLLLLSSNGHHQSDHHRSTHHRDSGDHPRDPPAKAGAGSAFVAPLQERPPGFGEELRGQDDAGLEVSSARRNWLELGHHPAPPGPKEEDFDGAATSYASQPSPIAGRSASSGRGPVMIACGASLAESVSPVDKGDCGSRFFSDILGKAPQQKEVVVFKSRLPTDQAVRQKEE